jgi:cardiolipin synthase
VLSFNFTHVDIDHSRGFGIVTRNRNWLREATTLFQTDCTRTSYEPTTDSFVVSPANSRKVLGTFLKRAKTQLLIYDPRISDEEMLRILRERAKAGVEIKVIGQVAGRVPFDVHKLAGTRLHTRTIIRDRHQAFVGSQSLRSAELDLRRELGLLVHDAKAVKRLIETFESDWTATTAEEAPVPPKELKAPLDDAAVASPHEAQKAVQVLTRELDPLASKVKKAVRKAVATAGEDVLHDKAVKTTLKKVVKKAVKEAVKEAVEETEDAGVDFGRRGVA